MEIPHAFQNRVARPLLPRQPAPEEICGILRAFMAYEKHAEDAVETRSPVALRHALASHPWINPEAATGLAHKITTGC